MSLNVVARPLCSNITPRIRGTNVYLSMIVALIPFLCPENGSQTKTGFLMFCHVHQPPNYGAYLDQTTYGN
jgi:hypothetical protein